MNIKKRLLSWGLTAAMVLGMLPASVFAAEAEQSAQPVETVAPVAVQEKTETSVTVNSTEVSSGTCGDNVTWALDDAGTLTISGSGPMEDYYYNNCPWVSTLWKSVVIEQGITAIGDYAFYNCSNLTEITIADSVTSIGDFAFYGCSSLTELRIPVSVNHIGSNAFDSCTYFCYFF